MQVLYDQRICQQHTSRLARKDVQQAGSLRNGSLLEIAAAIPMVLLESPIP